MAPRSFSIRFSDPSIRRTQLRSEKGLDRSVGEHIPSTVYVDRERYWDEREESSMSDQMLCAEGDVLRSERSSGSESLSSSKARKSLFQNHLDDEEWQEVLSMLRSYPSLAKVSVLMHRQGEKTLCLPLHVAVATKNPCNELIDELLLLHDLALTEGDTKFGRLPIHLALLSGVHNVATTKKLCNTASLLCSDVFGFTPLHYACQYSCNDVCNFFLDECPEACRIANEKDQLPLHLICARAWGDCPLPEQLFQRMVDVYPSAVKTLDRNGRIPLHWACDTMHPRGDVLSILIREFPSGLLVRERERKTPEGVNRRFRNAQTDQDVVINFLHESTVRERRRHRSLDNFFTIKINETRKPCRPSVMRRFNGNDSHV